MIAVEGGSAHALARRLGLAAVGPDVSVCGVAPLEDCPPGCLTFADRSPPFCAGVVIAVSPVAKTTTLLSPDPRGAFLDALMLLFPVEPPGGVMPGAHVHPTAALGPGVTIHPGAVVGARCVVGAGSVVFPNAVLYAGTVLGRSVRVHAGAVLGADGFSYHPGPDGPRRMPHLGRVVVEDGVEIGANTCIDRGALSDTVIGAHSKLDNLVQVGHNGRLGRAVLLAGQVGLSGSVTVGDGAVLGGQVGVADHRHIGAGARVGAQAGVSRDVPEGETVLGTPAEPAGRRRRVWAALRRLPELARAVDALAVRVAALERALG